VIFPGMVRAIAGRHCPEHPASSTMSWKANASSELVLQRKPELDSPTPEDLHEFGCAAAF